MRQPAKILLLLLSTLALSTSIRAQQKWPSPELEQMYTNITKNVAMGNYKDAGTSCRQAILLAPGMDIFNKQLGNILYLSGNYNEAEQILLPIANSPAADTQSFRLLGASQAAQQKFKKAVASLQKAIEHFPLAGNLYNEKGHTFIAAGNRKAALACWLDGIEHNPEYSLNYRDAALTYLGTSRLVWGLIYGETYLTMLHDTTGDNELKTILFVAYKSFFENISVLKTTGNTFEDSVTKTFTMLTPVISDGINTENLTMVRTRFLMEWLSAENQQHACALFHYLSQLAANGRFDIYNQWLFGKVENEQQFNAWNTFHDGDITRFEAWKVANPFHPPAEQLNDKNMRGLFSGVKKNQ
jgi:tetratricopeptide (TPR) repeat protein